PPLASTQALRRHPTMHTAAAVASAASVTAEAMPAASGSPLSSEQWPSSYQGNHSNSGSSSPASISLLHQQSRKRRRTGGPLSSPTASNHNSKLPFHLPPMVKKEKSISLVAMETASTSESVSDASMPNGSGADQSSHAGANGKELFVLSLAVILSLTGGGGQAPWDEFSAASQPLPGVAKDAAMLPQLPHDLALIGGLSSKSDRISDWLAANPLALRQQQAAYPSTIVGWSPSTSTNSMWNDQDTVALAFYQQPDSKDLMLGGGAAAGVSVLPKPLATMSSSSNGSQSPPQSTTSSSLWWQAGLESDANNRDEHLSESELQINAELDQLFPLGELDQLGFDPDSFMGLLNEPAVDFSGAAGTDSEGQMMSAMLMPPKSEDGDQSEGFKTEECAGLRAMLHNHTYAASADAAAPWQPLLGNSDAAEDDSKSGIYMAEAPRLLQQQVDYQDYEDYEDNYDSRDMRSAMYRNKDPARLVAAGVKLTYNEVVTCSHQKFLALLQCYNRKQQAVLQEVRKRGKNRLAASKCRQKKSDRVGRVREELSELGQRTNRLAAQTEAAQAEERRLRDKYMQLYLTAFGRLRDAENRPLDPRVHRLQHGLDGSVILVARDAA
ncbi:hypothetical protein BOX15_Mlig017557g3, partial [Macrostomum lignano]